MNALTLSATRRRDQVVILTGLRYRAQSITPLPARLAAAMRPLLTASRILTAVAVLSAVVAMWCSLSFVMSGGAMPSPMLAVSSAVGLVSAVSASLTSITEGGKA